MDEIDEHGFVDITLEDWRNIHIGHKDKLVDGATLNNLLKSQFILFSNSVILQNSLPGGIECWSELCETMLIMLYSLCTIQQLFRRIFVLFIRSLMKQSSSVVPAENTQIRYQKTDKDLAYGALEFIKIWFEHFRSFIPPSIILEISFLLEEYVDYIGSIGFTRGNLKNGGIGIHCLEKLYELHDIVKSCALRPCHRPILIKQQFLTGTWNPEEENSSQVASNKKPFKDEKKKVSTNPTTRPKTDKQSSQPVINIFGVTPDMLDDDDDASWDQPPPPLLLTSHLSQTSPIEKSNEIEDGDPFKNFPVPRIPVGTSLLQDSFQVDLFSFDLQEIARQWTLIDHESYISISLASYYNCEWSLPRHEQSYLTLPIRSFIDQFNSQSCWITESLILAPSTEKRLLLYARFIELAGYLEKLNNFNGVMAILTALQQGCVTRLKDMMKLVDDKSMKQLQRIQTLMSGSKNYQQYREVVTLRSAALPCDIEDWTYTSYIENENVSTRHLPIKISSVDGVTAIVPHLGAHLAELTGITEGNPTYLSDFPHLLNLEKKRLFARCLSQLRRIHGMHYCLHPIPLIQAVLFREFRKGKHLSAQESSDWSKKMYQLSLKLDMKLASEETSDEDDEESPTRFGRPTLTKAKSLLGGNWSSSRRLSDSQSVTQPLPISELSLAVDTSTPVGKPPLVPSRSSQISMVSPPAHSPQSSTSLVTVNNMTPTATHAPEKKKGLKKLLNVIKFRKKDSGAPTSSTIGQSIQKQNINMSSPSSLQIPSPSNHRKMIL